MTWPAPLLVAAGLGAELVAAADADAEGALEVLTGPGLAVAIVGAILGLGKIIGGQLLDLGKRFLALQDAAWERNTLALVEAIAADRAALTAAITAQQTEHSRETAALREQIAAQDEASRDGWTQVSQQLDGILARCLARCP